MSEDDDLRARKEKLIADIKAKEQEIADLRTEITRLQRLRNVAIEERLSMVKALSYLD